MINTCENFGLVSVGVPTFNRPDALWRTLDIITSQTYKKLEIIVSDNASTDSRVKDVIEQFKVDPRVKYYKQDNNIGLVANAEFVLRNSSGEYFTWIADDDWRDVKFIETLVCALENNREIALAFCDYYEVFEDGSRAPGYPRTHLRKFKPFENKSRLLRIISYYWQDSYNGKCNLYYSLFRREMLAQLDIRKITENFKNLDIDCFVVFRLLQQSPVFIVDQQMCTLTVGNIKHYLRRNNITGGFKAEFLRKLYGYWIASLREKQLYIDNTDVRAEKIIINLLYFPRFFVRLLGLIAKKLSS